MSTLRDWLRSADPLSGEPPPSADDVWQMRHVVTAAARDTRPSPGWHRTAWIATAAVAALVAMVSVGQWRRLESRGTTAVAPQDAPSAMPDGGVRTRQLQFATPGGTRVIWVFNPEFEVSGGERP
jgi:hypothetical protein